VVPSGDGWHPLVYPRRSCLATLRSPPTDLYNIQCSAVSIHTNQHNHTPSTPVVQTLPQTPLGELTALPRNLSWILGDLLLKEWRGGEDRVGEGRNKRGRKSRERVKKEGRGKETSTYTVFCFRLTAQSNMSDCE